MIPTTADVRALFMGAHRQVMRITLESDAYSSDTVYAVLDDDTETELTQLSFSDGTESAEDTFILWKEYLQSASAGLEINEKDILVGGFVYDNYSMSTERIEIGSAIAAELTLKLQNYDGTFDSVKFEGVEMFVELGVKDWETDDAISWIPLGYFTADKQPKNTTSVSVTALDRMVWFDKDLDWDQFTFPITVQEIMEQTCTICGVTLATDLTTLPNYDYEITYATEVTASYRNIVQWVAFLTGTCAQIDENGELVFKWYSDCGITITAAERFKHDIEESDITLTGLYYKSSSGIEYLQGTADYALEYADCELLQNNVETALANIWSAVEGFSYRPFSATLQSCPFLQPLDMITFTDKDGVDQTCIISKITFTGNQSTPVAGPGASATVASYAALNGLTSEQQLQVDDAKRQATNYLSMDETGIMIANMTDGTRYTPSEIPDGIKNTFIDEDSFDVRNGQTVLASFGETSQIGQDEANRLIINDSGIQGVNSDSEAIFEIGMDCGVVAVIKQVWFTYMSYLWNDYSSPSGVTNPTSTREIPLTRYNIVPGSTMKFVIDEYCNSDTEKLSIYKDFVYRDETVHTFETDRCEYSVYYSSSNDSLICTATLKDDAGTITYADNVNIGYGGKQFLVYATAPAFSLGIREGETNAAFSVICGEGLTAETRGQFACGRYNVDSTDYAMTVGNGDETNGNSNALAVTWDGDVLCDIDIDAAAGDDYTLYSLITQYGWEEEVIVDA